MFSLVSALLLKKTFFNLFMLLHIQAVNFEKSMCSIPFYVYANIYLSILLLMDICIFPIHNLAIMNKTTKKHS